MSDTLTLNLKAEYFNQIRDGVKPYEYRLRNEYWKKRLVGRSYKWVEFCLGYPKKDDSSRRIKVPYRGYHERIVTHKHFGDKPTEVFAIMATEAYAS